MVELRFSDCPKEHYEEKDNDGILCCHAYENGKETGYCLFRFEEKSVVLVRLRTDPYDFALCDGLVRAVLNYSLNRMKETFRAGQDTQLRKFLKSSGIPEEEALIESILSRVCDGIRTE